MQFFRSSQGMFLALLVALIVQGRVANSGACQYCRLAATDPEAARMAAQMHSGGFPLDATINQFQGMAPAATLTAPPAPDSVVTSVADLPPTTLRPRTVAEPATTAIPREAKESKEVAPAATPKAPLRWADVSLLGLAGAGGWFYWRTRRDSAPVS